MNGRAARTGSASEKFGRKVRARNARSTFDKPLACVTGIFDHAFGKPLTWIADKFTYTFDPLLTASKGISKEHLWYAIYRRSQVSKNGLYRLWSGWQRRFQRWSLMRVKSHQIRAKVAFTKPFTTHLMRGKGDFSCRGIDRFLPWIAHPSRSFSQSFLLSTCELHFYDQFSSLLVVSRSVRIPLLLVFG